MAIRPCKIRLQIEGDPNTYDLEEMGFHLMESPDMPLFGQRDYETEDFPENNGVSIYPYTTYKAFDYKIKFLAWDSIDAVNARITDLYAKLFEPTSNGDVRKAKLLTVINDYKGVIVTGYAKDASGADTFIEVEQGGVIFDFTLYCADPSQNAYNSGVIRMNGSISMLPIWPVGVYNSGRLFNINSAVYTKQTLNIPAGDGFTQSYARYESLLPDNPALERVSVNDSWLNAYSAYKPYRIRYVLDVRSNYAWRTTDPVGARHFPATHGDVMEFSYEWLGDDTFNTYSLYSEVYPSPGHVFEVSVKSVVPIVEVSLVIDDRVVETVDTDNDMNFEFFYRISEEQYDSINTIVVRTKLGNDTVDTPISKIAYYQAMTQGYKPVISL